MNINGKISIDVEKGTVTIQLENGAYCLDHYPNGIQSFLREHIEYQLRKM